MHTESTQVLDDGWWEGLRIGLEYNLVIISRLLGQCLFDNMH